MAPMFNDICQSLQRGLQEIAQAHQQKIATLERELQELRMAVGGRPPPPPPQLGGGAVPAPPMMPHPVAAAGYGVNGGAETNEAFRFERIIKIHEAPVHGVAVQPNTDIVATASWDASVRLYNVASDSVVSHLGDPATGEQNKMGGLYAVGFAKTNPDILACASCDKTVYLWNHRTGKQLRKLQGHQDEVNGIDFHGAQQVMATASDDCKAIIWDFQEGITLRTLDKHPKQVYGTSFLGQENQYLLATCCFDQKTRVWDMRDKSVVTTLHTHSDDVIGIDYTSSKQLLATGSDDGIIAVYESRMWRLSQKIETKLEPALADNEVKRVRFSPNGDLLAAGCSSGRVLIYDTNNQGGSAYAILAGHTDCVFDVAWVMRDNQRALVSASHDHTCRYWIEG